ncbi:ArsR/SmtB family transcription factor [Brevibacterium jeotgali]|uniref:Transcriptional regulator, ArsR family n=1 Tax=Brevibacterium jeotgali TaxID=1262550 RepID=A0A2H1L3M2_9MICO|nr:winged helix-turn-helix domain-containing protein [Brevibacterium jeotgali]TWC01753.1 DNA-binding transcriptional ArsR family regulator [Brevibacterium jeotgali]SMY11498.1 transcriptional regulator, ArsR family [Brevibacterium jeotgali]
MDSRSPDPGTAESGARRRDRDFSALGKALASPARSVMLSLLMDGTVRPAGELARAAGVSASTASGHLWVLVDAGLVTCTARGRGRYYRLSGPEVAHALETLGHIAPAAPATGYTGVRAAEKLASGRFCYDHLAGRLGVGLTRGWVAAGWLDDPDHLQLTSAGRDGFADLGVDVIGLDALRRPTTRACPDWTERRPHLAGALGAAVAALCVESEWVVRRPGSRGVRVTDAGAAVFRQRWGVSFSP